MALEEPPALPVEQEEATEEKEGKEEKEAEKWEAEFQSWEKKIKLEEEERQERSKDPFEKVNPDNSFDDLPEPYRTINQAIEEVLEEVGQGIDKIEAQRRSAAYEFDLLKASPTSSLLISGRVTCAYAEARGSSRLALGFSHGEVVLADTRTKEVLKSTRPFENGELVKCMSMVSDGAYHQPPPAPGQASQERLRPTAKLLVSSSVKPSVLVYDICRDLLSGHGTTLKPFCAINVPAPEEPAADADAEVSAREPQTPIEQLHARGTYGAIWVVVLLFDRTIRTYMCPLGLPENAPVDKKENRTLDTIKDDEEAELEIPEDAKDFGKVMQINTPKYCISLPSMVPLPGLPEPSLNSLLLSVCTLRPDGAARRPGVSQVPTFCFLSSRESNVLFCYSFRGPEPAKGAEKATAALEPDQAVSMEALLKQVALEPGALQEPTEALNLSHHRRWLLPARTSAMAVSPDGGTFAAGGSQGSLAVINTAAGPSLQAMLSGHYEAVVSLAFHKSDVLISVGADSWIHIFSVRSATLLARFLASRPPAPPPPPPPPPPPARPPPPPPPLPPPPAVAVAASLAFPMALTLDTCGGIRLLDLVRCRKMAGALWYPQRDRQSGKVESTSKPAEKSVDGYPPADAPPTQVLATSGGFTILCYEAPKKSTPVRSPAPAPDAAAEEAGAAAAPDSEAPAAAPAVAPEPLGSSYLVFFDYSATLTSLFPGIAARMSLGDPVVSLFQNLTPEEMAEKPAEGQQRLLDQSATLRPVQASRTGSSLPEQRKTMTQRTGTRSFLSTKKSLASTGASAAVAKLTTENLQKLDKPSGTKSLQGRAISEATSEKAGGLKVEHPHSRAQAIPENWQAGVKRHLRNTMADKTVRQGKILKYIDAIRKELEG